MVEPGLFDVDERLAALSAAIEHVFVVATDTIDYVVTDTWGNSATSTRTVIVEAATVTATATDTSTSTSTATSTPSAL